MNETRDLHNRAMNLFEHGLLNARAGRNSEARRLFGEALENEAAAADTVSQEQDLEPTRSILHRSAASIALRIGDIKKAKYYLESGLTPKTPPDVREELTTLQEQIRVLEAVTKDYRLRGPRGPTLIEQISRRYRSVAPVNITGLAKALGLAVRQVDMSSDVAGEIFPDLYRGGFSGFTIRVNALDSVAQKRLTVAHEIAHFLRHRNRIENRLVDNRMYRSKLDSTKEREAEELAYDLLMPRALIGEFRSKGMTDVSTLAERFQVPLHIMKKHLRIRD